MKKYLLGTNVISELIRLTPEPSVRAWFATQQEDALFISAVTVGEVVKGIAALKDSKKRSSLSYWLEAEVIHRFQERILPFDEQAAVLWGEWNGKGQLSGKPLPILDSQIAAIAARFECMLVTRNKKDVEGLPVEVFNPWE